MNGDIYNESNYSPYPLISSANVLIDYHTPDSTKTTIEGITEVEYSTEVPDLRMNNNTVKLTKNGYYVYVESSDGQTVLSALFKPCTELVPLFTISYDQNRIVNWLSASSKMKVSGTLTVNKGTALKKTYVLKNANGYHDHNWGYWAWSDDIGWNWGQASEPMTKNDNGMYTFSFGDVTNNDHTESKSAVLNLWKNKKTIADFKDDEIKIQHTSTSISHELPNNPFALVTVLNATSAEDTLNIMFIADSVTPIPIPIGISEYLVIWEMTGTYYVNGSINRKSINYDSK